MELMTRFDEIIAADPRRTPAAEHLGNSREGRPIRGHRFGTGPVAVSLLAGCHADEPVGPRLMDHLVSYLSSAAASDPMLASYEWWIVPHINPDGAGRNAAWQDAEAAAYDLGTYLKHVVRELPGDDIEFGFPRDAEDEGARSENRAVYDWWRTCDRPFVLHASLHGTGFAAGPWFLIEGAWRDRVDELKQTCAAKVAEMGYVLHDIERLGEKGFERLERGFHTRPDSRKMIAHFEALEDFDTAAKFRPSSMETIRSLGHDTLTLVTEMPHFITPGVGEQLGPPDPILEEWRRSIERWRAAAPERAAEVTAEAAARGLAPMAVADQMQLQWRFITAGLDQATRSP